MADFSALPCEDGNDGVEVSCALGEHHVDDHSATFAEESPGTEVSCAFVEHHVDDHFATFVSDGETVGAFGNSLDSGLECYYSFDVDESDVSGHGYDLGDGGGSPQPVQVTGKLSNGYYFDGGAFDADPGGIRTDYLTSFSFSCWVYRDGTVPWEDWEVLIYGFPEAYCQLEDGHPTITNWSWSPGEELSTAAPITMDAWHHLFFSYDEATKEAVIVVDGNWAGRTSTTFSHAMTLWPYNYGYALFGTTMDEVGLWNRVLTETEVGLLYNSGAGLGYSTAETPVGVDVSCAVVEHHVDDHFATFEES